MKEAENDRKRTMPPIGQNSSSQELNAYLVKNSRFMKAKERDSRLFRSPRHDDYLVLNQEVDLIERLGGQYILVEIFDELANESPSVRELTTLLIWKGDELQEKTKELLNICTTTKKTMEEIQYAQDPSIRNLYDRSKTLSDEIADINDQISHIRSHSKNEKIWPEPSPFPEELLPVMAFNPLFLPEPLRKYALDVSETMQSPIDYIAVGLLTTFSSIIGAGCAIRPLKDGDWTIIPNLWGAIVGPPSVKKTPALNASMAPLAALEKKADEDFAQQKLKADVDKVEYDARRKSIKIRIEKAVESENQNELESAKAALLSLESGLSLPQCKRFKTNDSTVAKLTELLAENPRGLLVFRDELIGFLVTLEQEGREDSRAFYIEAWSGWCPSIFKTDRIARGLTACNPCVSILGGIQPSKLRLYLQSALANIGNDGLIQRFQLLVFPDRPKEWKLIDRRSDDNARKRVKNIGEFLAATNFISIGARMEEDFPLPIFRFDHEAQAFFYNWYQHLEEKLLKESDEGMATEHLAKYRSLMPSIALGGYLIRIADGASPGKGIALTDAIGAADMCVYLETHARRIYSMIENKGIYTAKTLLKKIREGSIKDGFTQREVYRKGWSGLDNKGTDDACTELVLRGWLKEEVVPSTSKGGPSVAKYRLHPNLQKKTEIDTAKTDG